MLPENRINQSSNPADNAEEKIEVDLNEVVEVDDAQGDVNIQAKLPPHQVYTLKWEAGKDENSIYASKTKKEPHRAFVGAGLIGRIQDDEFEGVPVFVNHINSLQQRGKTTSDLHHFLNVIGSPASNRSSIGELLEHTKEALNEIPAGMAEIDWKASYKNDKGEWKDIKTTMTGFPKHKDENGNWDGTYDQTLENPITGEPVNAQLYVRAFLTQSEANKIRAKLG